MYYGSDILQFSFIKLYIIQRSKIIIQLVYTTGTYQYGCYPGIFQQPCNGHLRKTLPALIGYFIKVTNFLQGFRCNLFSF